MFLVRVALPDRPGALGVAASALGVLDVDINAIEFIEHAGGMAIVDFVVDVPKGVMPDALVSAVAEPKDVEVRWISFFPSSWNLLSDIQVLEEMTQDPQHAESILAHSAPRLFRADWAVLVDPNTGRIIEATDLAPELTGDARTVFGDLTQSKTDLLKTDWLKGWPETQIAVAKCCKYSSLVVARRSGLSFLDTELARMRHLAALAHAVH